MKELLEKVWRNCETKELAAIFEEYMKSIGVRKYDGRRKDNANTYIIDGTSTEWNRVQCFYHKDSTEYCEEDLLLALRKRSGNYFILQRKDSRAFEIDYNGVRHYDEDLMNEIVKDHKELFNKLKEVVKI